ncbi:hypothetical protein [Nonlabens antarcticus]|uniref:hypothetical protein n=1 Tax=Nonlabens antarcticus TaxID=392714 RepID=UPI001890CDB3|nr:hypothetical protein [Nonlabens antarcticus]
MAKTLRIKDELHQKIKVLVDGLSQNLNLVSEIKLDVVKRQRFELGAEMRDVEKSLERLVQKLEKMTKKIKSHKELR